MPLRTLFEHATVSDLAQQIEIALKQGRAGSLLPLLPVDRVQILPLSFAQERLWFLDQLMPNSPLYNMPAAVRLVGSLDQQALIKSFQAIVHRHEVLRTTFPMQESGQPYQQITPPFDLDIPVIDLEALPAEEREDQVRAIAIEEAARPFNLTQDPMARVTLLRLGQTEHIVLVILHHIVADGWSVGILMSELAALYPAYQKSPANPRSLLCLCNMRTLRSGNGKC
ncbi:MAG: hypothetical protein HC768_21840 [Acaryochloris sp. CRU_2_0]|nr:hypothetical protein [Acaryochloris sp. CRU_2_0]